MKYTVDDLNIETASKALSDNLFGLETTKDSRGIAYVNIWTDNDYESTGECGGYIVGHLSRNTGTFPTYTLVLDEFHNDNNRVAAVLTNILRRTTLR